MLEQLGDAGAAAVDLLEVVEHEEHVASRNACFEGLEWLTVARDPTLITARAIDGEHVVRAHARR